MDLLVGLDGPGPRSKTRGQAGRSETAQAVTRARRVSQSIHPPPPPSVALRRDASSGPSSVAPPKRGDRRRMGAAVMRSGASETARATPPAWLARMSDETNRSIAYMAQLIKGQARTSS